MIGRFWLSAVCGARMLAHGFTHATASCECEEDWSGQGAFFDGSDMLCIWEPPVRIMHISSLVLSVTRLIMCCLIWRKAWQTLGRVEPAASTTSASTSMVSSASGNTRTKRDKRRLRLSQLWASPYDRAILVSTLGIPANFMSPAIALGDE